MTVITSDGTVHLDCGAGENAQGIVRFEIATKEKDSDALFTGFFARHACFDQKAI
jgi:hypothetical protein